jgi:predicted AAA+ superfamily ATPase
VLKKQKIDFKRYLFEKIDFDDKMIAVFGARGVGKTTMLLQYLQTLLEKNKKALYISLDYPFLSGVDLIELVEGLVEKEEIEYLLLDEVHRFRDFGLYLKSIYDLFDIKVVYTSSSASSLLSAKSDLSRRVTHYKLSGFSFREFLNYKHKSSVESFSLEDILNNHIEIAKNINIKTILSDFKIYLENGYYPFYFDKRFAYYQTLLNTINLTIDIDLTSIGLIEQKYTYKLKKLLEIVCLSEPFEVNFTKIASLAEISRVKLYDYLQYLNDAELLLLIQDNAKGLKKLSKPSKIYLNNTNLLYAYCDNSKKGTIRETFFANQLSLGNKVSYASRGDFLVDEKYIFEIGGKNKSFKQIKDIPNSFIVADDIEIGFGNKIPLWLFGFLY